MLAMVMGSEEFVEKSQEQLGARLGGLVVVVEDEGNARKEHQASYSTFFEGEKDTLRLKNS